MWEGDGERAAHAGGDRHLIGGGDRRHHIQASSFYVSGDHHGVSRSSEYSHHQDVDSMSSLGLTLNKTPSFLNLIECYHTKKKENVDDSTSPVPMSEKLKASNFRADLLKIGDWKVVSRHDGNIVAKCYYSKRKLVWEILEGPLKSKIELQWSNIVGIRATIIDNQPSILEIELDEPPLFYRETAPQPKKHTLWQQSHDFTGGQASKCRRHYVIFPPGALAKTYENILLCDPRLNNLSRSPFPSQQSPYFAPLVNGSYQLFGKEYGSIHHPQGVQCQYKNYRPTFVRTHQQHCATLDDFDSPMSVVSFNSVNDQANNYSSTQFGDNQEFNVLNYDGETAANKEVPKLTEHQFWGEGESEIMSPYSQHDLFSTVSFFDALEDGIIYRNTCMDNSQENVMLPELPSEQQGPPTICWPTGRSSLGGSSMMELPQQNQPIVEPSLYHLPNQDFSRVDDRNHEVQHWSTMMPNQVPAEDWNNNMMQIIQSVLDY